MAFAAGEVAEAAHVDERDVLAPAPRDLRHGAALHLDGLRLELGVQPSAQGVGIDEGVAGQDGAEMDGGDAPADADGFRQRLQRSPLLLRAGAHHRLGHGVARLPFLPQRGPAARLDGVEAAFAVHAEIVLGIAGADHESPTPSAGSRPPATPHIRSARQPKRSSNSAVATPALTLPAPDSTKPPCGRRSRRARRRGRRFPAPGPSDR